MKILAFNTTSQPRPLPSPPPCPGFTTYQERFEQGALIEPVSQLNRWHDFSCKNISTFVVNFLYPFSPGEFLSFFGKLFFRIPIPLLLNSFWCTLEANLSLQSFCTLYANDLAKPANHVLIPVFPFVQWTVARGGAGGGGVVKRVDLCLTLP